MRWPRLDTRTVKNVSTRLQPDEENTRGMPRSQLLCNVMIDSYATIVMYRIQGVSSTDDATTQRSLLIRRLVIYNFVARSGNFD